MIQTAIHELHQTIEKRNRRLIGGKREIDADLVDRTLYMHEKRGAEIVRSFTKGDVARLLTYGQTCIIDYWLENERLIKMNDTLYLEEWQEWRRALFVDGELQEDEALSPIIEDYDYEDQMLPQRSERSQYDRREAVRYAERWWNDYNPAYPQFTDNCTNFISQCLRAGGAPMVGFPDTKKGWWYSDGKWSLSWSVAHSFRWYLSGAKTGLRGEERDRASDLELGDVICYDFDGDGRWQHSTIVVAFDANREPLVNAQTSNSRMRYWAYEDSTAWTPNIKYKFFHIVI